MKKVILAILLTALVCGGGAYFYIENFVKDSNEPSGDIQDDQKENDNNDDVTGKEEENQNEVVEGADFYGTYDENSLIFQCYGYEDKDDTSCWGENITGFSISGLKNKDVQSAINKNIKENIDKIDDKLYLSIDVTANFNNILSISIRTHDDAIKDYDYSYVYLNYDLTTGKNIELKDLFVKDNEIKSLLSQAFYDTYSFVSPYCNDCNEKTEQELKDYKNNIPNILANIEKGDYQFNISTSGIYIYSKGERARLSIGDYHKQLAYFTRFLSEESIFENDFGKKDLPIYRSDVYQFEDDLYKFGKAGDYGFYNIIIYPRLDDEKGDLNSKYTTIVSNTVYSYIEDYTKNNIKNDCFSILEGEIYLGEEYDFYKNGFTIMHVDLARYSLEKKLFSDDKMKKFVWETLNYSNNGVRHINIEGILESNYEVESLRIDKNFIIDKNGKLHEINNVSDMFNENFDYKKVLDSKLKVKLKERYEELSEKQIDEIIKDAKYSIVTDGIEASVESELFSNWTKSYSTEFEFDEIGLENIKFYKG